MVLTLLKAGLSRGKDMNIIIEGPDGAGKSTLIKDLVEHFPNSTVSPSTAKIPETIKTFRSRVKEFNRSCFAQDLAFMDDPSRIRFIDRSPYISEFIYGSILRNEVRISSSEIEESISGKLVIFVIPNFKVYMSQKIEIGKSHKSGRMVSDVRRKRKELFHAYCNMYINHLKTIRYDRANVSFEELLESIYFNIKQRREFLCAE